MRTILVLMCLAFTGGMALASPATPVIHQVTASDQGLAVNCYIIEGQRGLVVVDSALTISDSKALRKHVDALKKPLQAILVTHGHPDHYNGVLDLLDGKKVPVFATAAVAKVIRDYDAAKEKQWKPVFGVEWPSKRAFPDHEVKDAEKLTFGDLTFVAHALGPAESYADSYWELVGADRAAFIGDEVMNGSHAYTNDGHTAEWLKNLDRLERELAGVKHIYPGHGPAGGAAMFGWERQYLVAYRAAVNALRGHNDHLTDEQKATLVAKMKAAYPTATNEFMIALGADTVAAELARAK